MSQELAFEIYYIELFHVLSVVLSLCLNYLIYLKARKTRLLYYYLTVQALILIWLLAKIFKTVSPDVNIRWFFIVLQYFGNCYLGNTFLIFAYLYATGEDMRRVHKILLNIPPTFFFLCMASNPYHMLFYSYYDFYRDSFGPLFYIHQIVTYIYILIGLVLCSKNFTAQMGEKRIQAHLFAIAILVPLVINWFYILKLFKAFFGFRPLFDFTPIACNISLLLFAIATFKYRFLDIVPFARRTALKQIGESIMLCDKNANITDYNDTFTQLFSISDKTAHHRNIHSVIEKLPCSDTQKQELHTQLRFSSPDNYSINLKCANNMYLKTIIQPLYFRKQQIGMGVRFIDITNQCLLQDELTKRNQHLHDAHLRLEERAHKIKLLAAMRIRNYIAREVHDILGHSMVLAVTILEVAHITFDKNPENTKNKIEQTITVLKDSLKDLENSLRENCTDKLGNHTLLKAISMMAEEFKDTGIKIEVITQGKIYNLPSQHSENIYRLCQEAITNSIRHGKADTINIILRFSTENYEIYILDNGRGCAEIAKGYGLAGMEKRVTGLKGVLRYGSDGESGFSIHATVPSPVLKTMVK